MEEMFVNPFAKKLLELNSFVDFKDNLVIEKNKINLQGVLDSQKEHLIFAIKSQINNKSLVITHNEKKAREMYNNLRFYLKEDVYLYPQKDILFYSADVKSIDIMKERSKIYEKLFSGENITIVLSIDALFDRLSPKEILQNNFITISIGDIFSLENLISILISIGYKRRSQVENAGQFSVRGGIIDIFTTTLETAIRIEFWGDEIDSIRILDENNVRSVEKIDTVKISPVTELIFTKDDINLALTKINLEYTEQLKTFESQGMHEEYDNLRHTFNQIIEGLEEFGYCKNMELLLPYFYEEKYSLFDYLDSSFIVFFDEFNRIEEKSNFIERDYNESLNSRLLKGYTLKTSTNLINTTYDILYKASNFRCVNLSSIMSLSPNSLFTKNETTTIEFSVQLPVAIKNDIVEFKETVKEYKEKDYSVVILTSSKTKGITLAKEFEYDDIHATFYESSNSIEFEKGIYILRGSLSSGFIYPDIKFIVFNESDVFQNTPSKKVKKFKDGKKISNYTDLKVGDYVVHINHGIGVFKGVEKITIDGISKDYVKIGFADNGNIYAPTNQLDLIQKYIGKEVNVKLNKLGGGEWQKTKLRTKKAIEILAQDLIELYAKRESSKGYEYSKDSSWQSEFEGDFPYVETDDQIGAIIDVKSDMESSKVMDRLICGDVGYGKTEIAIRAAFKAVQDGKQVAYLCPTTILAQQHYNTFVQRMQDYPINIELLSRFRTKKQIEQALEKTKIGNSNIIIGTHRLLSKDVTFYDLGLVIVDEEQRFGVTHKEKLKKLKKNVDVMTLTATPIPRTLHMSMSGIRDMSVLSMPPMERLPIQTYVLEHNDAYIREAINRELNRNGQVFYLHNRVSTIEKVADNIKKLVPDATVVYAHGQMSERQLENIMNGFINKEYDILVCTTIIETGLDISNANTIIIDNADSLGLSTLYQLRGRVGRSHRNAFAYLLYKRDKVLSEVAEKRLETIKNFTEFGSGFKIAMRDLEIRGAGSLLGEHQSGHLETVGYEMYCKLLDEAIHELQGKGVKKDIKTTIEMQTSAFIPNTYIHDELQKIDIYKKISMLRTTDDLYDLEDELVDRFGDIPKEVIHLTNIAILKVRLNSIGITNLTQKGDYIHLLCTKDANISIASLENINKIDRARVKVKLEESPLIIYKIKGDYREKNYDLVYEVNQLLDDITLE